MRQNVELSVCITTFNMEKYIERAIESVQAQKTDFEYEIIVADDCSTDNTIALLQRYQRKMGEKFRILYAERNRELFDNFLLTVHAAKGKYIASLDADDYWIDEYKLQKQIDIMDKDEAVGFVYTNYQYRTENSQAIIPNNDKYIHTATNHFQTYLLHPYICPSTICFKKTLVDFDLLSVFTGKRIVAQDYVLFLGFLSKSRGFYLNEITTEYLVREDSSSRTGNIKKKISTLHNNYAIGNYFIDRHPVGASVAAYREFKYRQDVLLAAWQTNDFPLVKRAAKQLSIKQFFKHNPKALYIFIASKSSLLYKLCKPWLLRKRRFTGE